MKTVAYLTCAALIALPQGATYAALEGEPTEADYARATRLCPDDPGLPERARQE